MSWFNRRPKIKEPAHTPPKTTSPMTVKQLKEAKEAMKPVGKKNNNKRKLK